MPIIPDFIAKHARLSREDFTSASFSRGLSLSLALPLSFSLVRFSRHILPFLSLIHTYGNLRIIRRSHRSGCACSNNEWLCERKRESVRERDRYRESHKRTDRTPPTFYRVGCVCISSVFKRSAFTVFFVFFVRAKCSPRQILIGCLSPNDVYKQKRMPPVYTVISLTESLRFSGI